MRAVFALYLAALIAFVAFLPGRPKAWVHGGSVTQCFNFVAVGDSITVGFGATNPYPANIASSLSTGDSVQAVSGIGYQKQVGGNSLTSLAAGNVDPQLSSLACGALSPYLIMLAGVNDIFNGSTGAQVFTFSQTYRAARVSAGWSAGKMVVATILPSTASETDRASYNAALVSAAGSEGYILARLDLDANIGCAGCNTNLTYYQSDQIHPNNTGLQIVANLICLAMKPSGPCPVY